MNLANDHDLENPMMLVVHQHQTRYVEFGRFSRPEIKINENFGIYNYFGITQVGRADFILVAITDPNGEPPYIYRFYKNRTGWTTEATLEYSPFFRRYLSMSSARLEVVDTRGATAINLVMDSKADLVLFRMMTS